MQFVLFSGLLAGAVLLFGSFGRIMFLQSQRDAAARTLKTLTILGLSGGAIGITMLVLLSVFYLL